MTEKKRILFVDDDPDLLGGLRNVFYRDRKQWDMTFALGGQLGLDEVRRAPVDVVVSDMQMPGMDGATLLRSVKEESPATVRIMLTGHASRAAIGRLLPALHQLLAKPCTPAVLREVIERSVGGVDPERDARIRRIIGSVDNLPTPSDVFFELSRLLQIETSSVAEITAVVTRDPALSVKMLQLVNNAYFGAHRVTTTIPQAVSLLGLEQVRFIALSASVFVVPVAQVRLARTLDRIREEASCAARLARAFAEPAQRDVAFASALLGNLGEVVLALCREAEFQLRRERIGRGERERDVELDLFGVTHHEIGARLLAIWGLPMTIVDVVQFSQDPGSAPEAARKLAGISHVAGAFARGGVPAELDLGSLERAGCGDLVPAWRAIADSQGGAGERA